MLKSEVKVGETYYATISGKSTKVKITEEVASEKYLGGSKRRIVTQWKAKNLTTNKEVTIKSAQKLRPYTPAREAAIAKLANPGGVGSSLHPKFEIQGIATGRTSDTHPNEGNTESVQEASPRVSLGSLLSGGLETGLGVSETSPVQGQAIGLGSVLSSDESPSWTTSDAPFETDETSSISVKKEPTAEQRAILEEARKMNPVFIIEAGAGTGKTTTLRMLADVLRGNGQYTAFNKSLVNDSRHKFEGTRVACNTTHSLGFRDAGAKYSHRLGGARVRSDFIAKQLGIGHLNLDLGETKKQLYNGFLAGQVMQAIKRFCQSADREVQAHHFKYIDGIDTPSESSNNKKVRQYLLPYAEMAWDDLCNVNGQLPFMHDHYVKIWQLNDPVIVGDYVLLDEAQDTAPVMLDILKQQDVPVILVGDSCQPAGTLVDIVGGSMLIEDLKRGQRVVSYDIKHRHVRKTGSIVNGITKRRYKGELIDVVTDSGHNTSYTPNHICLARFGEGLVNKHMVYMMRKGGCYRIGVAGGSWLPSTENKNCLGITKRFAQEKADCMWVLAVFDTREEALIEESVASWRFGVPTLLFKNSASQDKLDKIWYNLAVNLDLEGNAKSCLKNYGRETIYPLADREGFLTQLQFRRLFEIRACNLLTGMQVPWWNKLEKHGTNHERDWTTIGVGSSTYDGFVYSMDVDRDKTYVGDGIITHNCQSIYEWRGAVNAMSAFPGATRLFLSQSFRFGETIADVANAVLSTLDEPVQLKLKGLPSINSKVIRDSLEGEKLKPACILTRTNALAVTSMLEAISAKRKPHLIGGGSEVVSFVKAAADLQQLKPTGHPELACFSSWQEVQEYAKMDEGEDLRLMVKLIDGFGCDTIVNALSAMVLEKDADVVICTAHKSKGREWDSVRIASDFPPASKCADSDRRLLYVAVTRAKLVLDLSRCPFFTGKDAIDLTEVIRKFKADSGMVTKPVEQAKAPEKFNWMNKDGKWVVRGPAGFESKTVEVFRRDGSSQRKFLISLVENVGPVSIYRV